MLDLYPVFSRGKVNIPVWKGRDIRPSPSTAPAYEFDRNQYGIDITSNAASRIPQTEGGCLPIIWPDFSKLHERWGEGGALTLSTNPEVTSITFSCEDIYVIDVNIQNVSLLQLIPASREPISSVNVVILLKRYPE